MKYVFQVILVCFCIASVCGCVSKPQGFQNSVRTLSIPQGIENTTKTRLDLIELSGCRVSFDVSAVQSEASFQIQKYNPYDRKNTSQSEIAVCPVRNVLGGILGSVAAKNFKGSESVPETRIYISSREVSLSKVGSSVLFNLVVQASLDSESLGSFEISKSSSWVDSSSVPECVLAAAQEFGERLLDYIGASRSIRDAMLNHSDYGGGAPKITGWQISDVKDGRFSGTVQISKSEWDFARVTQWARSQIESAAREKLGVKSLENYRIILNDANGLVRDENRAIDFTVYPYKGVEIPEYNFRTGRGVCNVDIAFLGISEQEAYKNAISYIEMVLSGQGVVLEQGKTSSAARYKLNGFKAKNNGTMLEIPFQLVE